MNNEIPIFKFKFTESSLEALVQSGKDPRSYLNTTTGIQLKNLGEEIKVLGKTKFIAFGEERTPVSSGIKVIVPEGYYATFLETPDILNTSLSVRRVIFEPGATDEIMVDFFNAGEREVVIPRFATLPVILIAKSFCKNSKVISDLEYLESAPAPKSPGVDN